MREEATQDEKPEGVTTVPAPSAWASARGQFIVATHACGCEVKVRDQAAAERMAQTRCRKHSV